MDESELKTGNKGETEAEEMGDENLEVTSSMVKQAAEKKKVAQDVALAYQLDYDEDTNEMLEGGSQNSPEDCQAPKYI
ncbi:hypothetical protein Q9966_008502 [Columba livia]|nr:hypothetical protein Q9966_008502 [Columba livia]